MNIEEHDILLEFLTPVEKTPKTRKCNRNEDLYNRPGYRERHLEKKKMTGLQENSLVEFLNEKIPFLPTDYKMPKVKTLRLTQKYIEHLLAIENGEMIEDENGELRDLTVDDFQAVVNKEMNKVNHYVGSALDELKNTPPPPTNSDYPPWSTALSTHPRFSPLSQNNQSLFQNLPMTSACAPLDPRMCQISSYGFNWYPKGLQSAQQPGRIGPHRWTPYSLHPGFAPLPCQNQNLFQNASTARRPLQQTQLTAMQFTPLASPADPNSFATSPVKRMPRIASSRWTPYPVHSGYPAMVSPNLNYFQPPTASFNPLTPAAQPHHTFPMPSVLHHNFASPPENVASTATSGADCTPSHFGQQQEPPSSFATPPEEPLIYTEL